MEYIASKGDYICKSSSKGLSKKSKRELPKSKRGTLPKPYRRLNNKYISPHHIITTVSFYSVHSQYNTLHQTEEEMKFTSKGIKSKLFGGHKKDPQDTTSAAAPAATGNNNHHAESDAASKPLGGELMRMNNECSFNCTSFSLLLIVTDYCCCYVAVSFAIILHIIFHHESLLTMISSQHYPIPSSHHYTTRLPQSKETDHDEELLRMESSTVK